MTQANPRRGIPSWSASGTRKPRSSGRTKQPPRDGEGQGLTVDKEVVYLAVPCGSSGFPRVVWWFLVGLVVGLPFYPTKTVELVAGDQKI